MRVAINGLGRIGRAVFKLLVVTPELELAAVNDVTPPDNLAYLLNHDTVYGRYANRVTVQGTSLVVADQSYPVYAEPDPSRLPWRRLNVDLVFECTGEFNRRGELSRHLDPITRCGAGAPGQRISCLRRRERPRPPHAPCLRCADDSRGPRSGRPWLSAHSAMSSC